MSELSPDTHALLDRGRDGDALGTRDKARLKRALVSQIAAASVVATTSTAAAWTTVAAKVAGVVMVVGAVTGGIVAVVPVAPRAVAPVTHEASAAKPHPASPVVTPPAPPPPPPIPAPIAAPPVVRAAEPIAPQPALPPPPSTLEEEQRLLRDADDALKAGAPDRALALLSDLATRFPDSALGHERAAERIFALCSAGRRDEAKQATAAFLSSEPTGPLALRVRASCGGH